MRSRQEACVCTNHHGLTGNGNWAPKSGMTRCEAALGAVWISSVSGRDKTCCLSAAGMVTGRRGTWAAHEARSCSGTGNASKPRFPPASIRCTTTSTPSPCEAEAPLTHFDVELLCRSVALLGQGRAGHLRACLYLVAVTARYLGLIETPRGSDIARRAADALSALESEIETVRRQ